MSHALICDLRSLWPGLNKLKGVEIAISSIKKPQGGGLGKDKSRKSTQLASWADEDNSVKPCMLLLNYLRLLSVRPLYCAGSSILIAVTTITVLLPRARNARFMLVKYFSPNLKIKSFHGIARELIFRFSHCLGTSPFCFS